MFFVWQFQFTYISAYLSIYTFVSGNVLSFSLFAIAHYLFACVSLHSPVSLFMYLPYRLSFCPSFIFQFSYSLFFTVFCFLLYHCTQNSTLLFNFQVFLVISSAKHYTQLLFFIYLFIFFSVYLFISNSTAFIFLVFISSFCSSNLYLTLLVILSFLFFWRGREREYYLQLSSLMAFIHSKLEYSSNSSSWSLQMSSEQSTELSTPLHILPLLHLLSDAL